MSQVNMVIPAYRVIELIELISFLAQCCFALTSRTSAGPGRQMVRAPPVRCSPAVEETAAKALG